MREQDIRKITDVFSEQAEVAKCSRMVAISEIADAKNEYNLNVPRDIDTQEAEDLQNIEAHLQGGIPLVDVDALQQYWNVFPTLRKTLFETLLAAFESNVLVNGYDMYQHLMQYWNETMQDDVYSIALDGWKAANEYQCLVVKGKKGKDGKVAKYKEIGGLAGV